jgi:hypothetical protein
LMIRDILFSWYPLLNPALCAEDCQCKGVEVGSRSSIQWCIRGASFLSPTFLWAAFKERTKGIFCVNKTELETVDSSELEQHEIVQRDMEYLRRAN